MLAFRSGLVSSFVLLVVVGCGSSDSGGPGPSGSTGGATSSSGGSSGTGGTSLGGSGGVIVAATGGTAPTGGAGGTGNVGTGGTQGNGGTTIVGSGGCSGPLAKPVILDSNCPDMAYTPTTGALAGKTFTLPGCCEMIGACGVRYRPEANGCIYPAVCGVPPFVPDAGARPSVRCIPPPDAGP